MNLHRIVTLVCACALGGVAGHWHARSGPRTEPAQRASALHSNPAVASAPLLSHLERIEPGHARQRALYEQTATLTIEQTETLARDVAAAEHSPSRTALLGALIERLVDSNPRAATGFYDRYVARGDPARRWLHIAWYRAWLDVDHAQAIRYATHLRDGPERDDTLLLAIAWCGAHTPLAARLSAALSPAARARYVLAQADLAMPAIAFERSLSEGDPQVRLDALRSSFTRLVHDDLERALRRAERIPEDERDAVVGHALGAWAKQDSRRAWHALDHAELTREHRVALFESLAEQAPHAALSWLKDEAHEHEASQRPLDLYRALVPQLLRDDLNAAATLVAELGRDAPLDLIQQIAVEHGKRDPLDGFTWAASVGGRSEFEDIQTLQAVSASVVAADPGSAAAFLNRTTDAQIRQPLMRAIASYKAQRSVRDAWTWLQTYRGDAAYRENARALLSAWSYAKPDEVAAIVVGIEDVEFQRGAAEQLVNVWRERDPNGLREWLATLPPSRLRETLMRSIARGTGEGQAGVQQTS